MTDLNFEELKTRIAEIVAICKDVPEEFRGRCFEILMNALLQPQKKRAKEEDDQSLDQTPPRDEANEDETDSNHDDNKPLVIPGHVRAFLRRQNLADTLLQKLVMIDGEELHWLKEPAHNNIRKGQNEWALLLALKNAVMGKATLSVDPEDVRSAAQDKGFYDKGNFATNFKSEPYKSWYKGEMTSQGTAQTLSKEGEAALAELIKGLTGI